MLQSIGNTVEILMLQKYCHYTRKGIDNTALFTTISSCIAVHEANTAQPSVKQTQPRFKEAQYCSASFQLSNNHAEPRI